MAKSKTQRKRPYSHFKWQIHVPAAVTVDVGKIEKAAKLLKLSSKDENGFAHYVQSLAEDYHGEPGVTASGAELKGALERFSKALSKAIDAWIMLHSSKIEGLRLGVLTAIKETYQDAYGPGFADGGGLRPSELFKADESALHRLENMVATTVKRIVPDPSGPAPEPRSGLAAEIFAIARYATMRNLTFGASARAGGKRSKDYRACVLLMLAIDTSLTGRLCERPLEEALKADGVARKTQPAQVTATKTGVRRRNQM